MHYNICLFPNKIIIKHNCRHSRLQCPWFVIQNKCSSKWWKCSVCCSPFRSTHFCSTPYLLNDDFLHSAWFCLAIGFPCNDGNWMGKSTLLCIIRQYSPLILDQIIGRFVISSLCDSFSSLGTFLSIRQFFLFAIGLFRNLVPCDKRDLFD